MFLFAPAITTAAQAAPGDLTVEINGSGAGEVLGGNYFGKFPTTFACSYASPGPEAGTCVEEMSYDSGADFTGGFIHMVAGSGSELANVEVVEGEAFFEPCEGGLTECAIGHAGESGEDAKVIVTFDEEVPPGPGDLTVEINGSGAGEVLGGNYFGKFPTTFACSYASPGPEAGTCVEEMSYDSGADFTGGFIHMVAGSGSELANVEVVEGEAFFEPCEGGLTECAIGHAGESGEDAKVIVTFDEEVPPGPGDLTVEINGSGAGEVLGGNYFGKFPTTFACSYASPGPEAGTCVEEMSYDSGADFTGGFIHMVAGSGSELANVEVVEGEAFFEPCEGGLTECAIGHAGESGEDAKVIVTFDEEVPPGPGDLTVEINGSGAGEVLGGNYFGKFPTTFACSYASPGPEAGTCVEEMSYDSGADFTGGFIHMVAGSGSELANVEVVEGEAFFEPCEGGLTECAIGHAGESGEDAKVIVTFDEEVPPGPGDLTVEINGSGAGEVLGGNYFGKFPTTFACSYASPGPEAGTCVEEMSYDSGADFTGGFIHMVAGSGSELANVEVVEGEAFFEPCEGGLTECAIGHAGESGEDAKVIVTFDEEVPPGPGDLTVEINGSGAGEVLGGNYFGKFPTTFACSYASPGPEAGTCVEEMSYDSGADFTGGFIHMVAGSGSELANVEVVEGEAFFEPCEGGLTECAIGHAGESGEDAKVIVTFDEEVPPGPGDLTVEINGSGAGEVLGGNYFGKFPTTFACSYASPGPEAGTCVEEMSYDSGADFTGGFIHMVAGSGSELANVEVVEGEAFFEPCEGGLTECAIGHAGESGEDAKVIVTFDEEVPPGPGDLTVEINGSGAGEVLGGNYFGKFPTTFACSYASPGPEAGTCVEEMSYDSGADFTGGFIHMVAGSGSELANVEVVEGEAFFEPCEGGLTECAIGHAGESGEDAKVIVTFDEEAEPPTVTNVAPDEGPTSGGQVVTISGEHLTGAEKVEFDTDEATILSDTATEIEVETPSHAAGTVDVTVTTPGGADTATGAYTYVEAPAVTEVEPNHGPASGGNSVKIKGTDLGGAGKVEFGAVEIASGAFLSESATEIEVEAPAGTAGETVVVVVCTTGGCSSSTPAPANEYSYDFEPPTVTNVAPDEGPTSGGQVVTISGEHLTGAEKVEFDTDEATILSDTATEIEVETPSHAAGTVDVTVTTPGGADTATGAYTYVEAPAVTEVEPNHGPASGGNSVKIKGTDLGGAGKVEFGAVEIASGAFLSESATEIEVEAPAGTAGETVVVVVCTTGGCSSSTPAPANEYSYDFEPPTVTNVAPDEGPTSGGQVVTISGEHLTGAEKVEFDTDEATILSDTATEIEVETPSHAAGTVDVTVTTPGGADTATGAYTYVEAPAVTEVEPNHGPASGGNSVKIKGTDLGGAGKVEFGAVEIASGAFLSESATEIEVEAPAGTAGETVVVVVCTTGGCSSSTPAPANEYSYDFEPPTVTNVAPGTITQTSIVLKGDVNNNGDPSGSTCKFVIAKKATPGTPVAEPACSPTPVMGSTTVPVEATASGLEPNMEYVYRVVATNAGGTTTGTPDREAKTLANNHNLKVVKTGSGDGTVTSSPAGIDCAPSCTEETAAFADGATVTLTATEDGESYFTGWTGPDAEGEGCDPTGEELTCEVEMDAAKEIEAEFTLEFELDVAVSGEGKVEEAPAEQIVNCRELFGGCTGFYLEGEEVVLVATPDPGAEFGGWGGCDSVAGNECAVTMGEARSVSARFVTPTPNHTLTVNKVGPGSGSVSCDGGACASSYPEGTTVTLSANADSGSSFTGWAGAGCSGTGNCVVTLNSDITVTAAFESNPPPPPPPPSGEAQIKGGKAQVKGNKAFIQLACRGGGACKGVLKLFAKLPANNGKGKKHKRNHRKAKNVLIGKSSFNLAASASKTIKVKLSGKALKQLRRKGKLVAQVKGSGLKRRNIQLRLPAARKHHKHHHKRSSH